MRLLKDNRLLLLLIIIIAFIFATSGRVLGLELHLNGDEVAHAWELTPSDDGTWFCTDSSRILRFTGANGIKSDKLIYEKSGKVVELSPQLSYALYYIYANGYNIEDYEGQIQGLVWGSVGDAKGSNDVSSIIGARAEQYYTVYDSIFSKIGNKQLFTTSSKESDLKVLVDQIDGTYTVGPYYLELNVNASNKEKNILYNEILGKGNQGFSSKTRFAQWSGKVTGINGTDVKMVDANGNQITFPDFVHNKPFYIKFKPNNNGAISETGNPVIHVRYIKKIVLSESASVSAPVIKLQEYECVNIVIPDNLELGFDNDDILNMDTMWIDHTKKNRSNGKVTFYVKCYANILVKIDMRKSTRCNSLF